MEDVGIFYGCLVCLMPIWYFRGHLVHFMVIWYIYLFLYVVTRKLWQPCECWWFLPPPIQSSGSAPMIPMGAHLGDYQERWRGN
jgi:hypothetical protein